jgi:hypothetical protein
MIAVGPFEAFASPKWSDGWRPHAFNRLQVKWVNRGQPPPHALHIQWRRWHFIYWYREKRG